MENIKILTPHQDGVAKHITLKEFINETNVSHQQMKNSFLKINKRENSSKVSLSDFDIDTTFIKKLIYQNNKKSFSIRAYKKGEDPNSRIYNLVYHQDNGIWKADIFQYTYTREWLEKYNTNALTPFSGRIQHIGSEKNISLRTSETYECSSQIEYLCYCANHTTSECNGCSQGFRNVLTLNCVATGSGGSGGGFGGSDITPPPNLGTPPYNDPQIGGGGLGDGTEFEPNLLSFDDPMYQKYTLMNDLKNAVWPKLQNYPDLYKKFENFHLQTNGDNLFNLSELANYASSNYQFTDWIIDFWSSNLSLPWSQIKNWFMNADGTPRVSFNSNLNDSNTELYNSWDEFFNTQNRGFTTNPSEYALDTNDNTPQAGDPYPITNSRVNLKIMRYTGAGLSIKVRGYNIGKSTFNIHDIIINQYGVTSFWSFVYEDPNNKWDGPFAYVYNGQVYARVEVNIIVKKGVTIKGASVTIDVPMKITIIINPNTGYIMDSTFSLN